jgi:hypothetical protein
MAGEIIQRDRENFIGQHFNHVAGLKVVFAVAIARQPPRSYVVNVVAGDKRIVIGFSDLVAEWRDIAERAPEKTGDLTAN